MTAYNKFFPFTTALMSGLHDFSNGSYRLMLSNTAFDSAANSYADLQAQELPAGNGYSAGGVVLSTSVTPGADGAAIVHSANVMLSVVGAVGPFRYVGIFGGVGNGAVCWTDLGFDFRLQSEEFTFEFDPLNGLFRTG